MKNIKFIAVFFFTVAIFNGSCQKQSDTTTPPITPTDTRVFYKPDQFVMGADMSYVNQLQDYGVTYTDSGKVKDPFVLLHDRGANNVRVRL